MKRGSFLLLVALPAAFLLSCSERSTPPDVTPPAAITDLRVQNTSAGLLLRWTAPGDDGTEGQVSRYDIRYAARDLLAAWESAPVWPSPSRPVSPGWTESVIVPGVEAGRWEFGIRAADEVPNWSEISNIAVVTIVAPDTIPPAPVTDLSVEAITRTTVTLTWTATGDDGAAGQAAQYNLRYAEAPITAETWSSTIPVPGLPVPRSSGGLERVTVPDLETEHEYWFAMTVVDEAGNESGFSNAVSAFVKGPYQLTFVQSYGGAWGPDWSPDGRSIVFTTSVPNTHEWSRPEIHVVSPDGGTPRRYTSFAPIGAQGARWSPDGSRFFFVKKVDMHPWEPGHLAVMDAEPDATFTILADTGLRTVSRIRVSPDGSRLAYLLYDPPSGTMPTTTGDLLTNSTTGDDPVVLLENVRIAGLDWSPDGSQLVVSLRQGDVYDLWLIPSAGGELTALTSGPDDKGAQAWSPDGSEIAYSSAGSFWAIPAAGGEPRRLITDTTGDWPWGQAVEWSPDGTRVVYEKTVGGVRNLWVSPVD